MRDKRVCSYPDGMRRPFLFRHATIDRMGRRRRSPPSTRRSPTRSSPGISTWRWKGPPWFVAAEPPRYSSPIF
ncbi:hypothetical protein GW17_00036495 [Ensete ventricosum]|nr:hypothetical protein GW17_00036495 [Ensete ventricosum]